MSIRLGCSDGAGVMVPKLFWEKFELFQSHPEITKSHSYELRCKVNSEIVNLFMRRVYDDAEKITVTDDNFSQLKSLSSELGFSGLDTELRAFEASQVGVTKRQLLSLEERVGDWEVQIEGFQLIL